MAKIVVGRVLDSTTDSIAIENGSAPILVKELNTLIPEEYDYIELGYTGADLTSVLYKAGGVGGTLVATLTLAYSGSDLVSVTRT